MNRRGILLAIGVSTAGAGLAMAFVPSLAAGFGSPSELPLALGLVAILGGLVRARTWFGHEDDDYRSIERERPTGVPAPGVEFDGMIERAPTRASRGGNTRLIMIRQSLREAAIETLVTYQGYTEADARRALNTGTWTDDEYAADFFVGASGGGGGLSESLASTFYGDTPFHRRAHSAAREIERLAGREW